MFCSLPNLSSLPPGIPVGVEGESQIIKPSSSWRTYFLLKPRESILPFISPGAVIYQPQSTHPPPLYTHCSLFFSPPQMSMVLHDVSILQAFSLSSIWLWYLLPPPVFCRRENGSNKWGTSLSFPLLSCQIYMQPHTSFLFPSIRFPHLIPSSGSPRWHCCVCFPLTVEGLHSTYVPFSSPVS